MKQRYHPPSVAITLTTLKRYLRSYNDDGKEWKQYRWFFATQTIKDLPVGISGAVIVAAGFLNECHRGWFLVATSATQRQLKHWPAWENCISVTLNREIQFPKHHRGIRKLERELGSDPRKWVEAMSSKNPDDWIYQHGSGIGRTNKPGAGRPKKVVDTLPES